MTKDQMKQKTNEMLQALKAVGDIITVRGKSYEFARFGSISATAKGGRGAEYTFMTCPRAKVIGRPDAFVISILRGPRVICDFGLEAGQILELGR